MNGMWAALGGLFAIIVGLWKFFGGKRRAKRARINAADKMFAEGMEERDPSKITASNARLNNDV